MSHYLTVETNTNHHMIFYKPPVLWHTTIHLIGKKMCYDGVHLEISSGVGRFGYLFGDYFVYNMGYKHPNMTSGGLLVTAATFGSAAMVNAGIATSFFSPISSAMSHILTLDGLITSPAKFTSAVTSIDTAWLWVTKASSSTMGTAIMTGVGLPKLTYMAVDEAVNKHFSDQDTTTLDGLLKEYFPKNVYGETTADERIHLAKTATKTLLLFGFSAGLGIL